MKIENKKIKIDSELSSVLDNISVLENEIEIVNSQILLNSRYLSKENNYEDRKRYLFDSLNNEKEKAKKIINMRIVNLKDKNESREEIEYLNNILLRLESPFKNVNNKIQNTNKVDTITASLQGKKLMALNQLDNSSDNKENYNEINLYENMSDDEKLRILYDKKEEAFNNFDKIHDENSALELEIIIEMINNIEKRKGAK